jgi:tRNA(Ile)-lysidine synthase
MTKIGAMAGKKVNPALGLALDRGLLRAGERVCVAVSGGADSVALLLSLVEANTPSAQNKEPLGVVPSAAHVHHGLRGSEADADAAFVQELCGRLGVPYRLLTVDVASRQALEGEGLEEAARGLRYEALCGLDVDAIATGHTLDDQAETVMMKLLRGAWTEGLGGISPEVQGQGKARIVRPLLGVRRVEVEEFLRSRGQAWREDASNRDLSLTRNRVRHELMPTLRSFQPGIDATLARMAAIARDDEAFWQAELARMLPQVLLPGAPVRGGGRAVSTVAGEAAWAVEITRLAAMPAALRRRVVRAAARSCGARLGAEETAKVLALAGLGEDSVMGVKVLGRSGSRLELSGGLRVERSARELRFWRES